MQMGKEFPQEFRIQLGAKTNYLEGRITVECYASNLFGVEVNIVQSESGKIFNHVTSLFNQPDPREALDLGVYHLKKYLESKKI